MSEAVISADRGFMDISPVRRDKHNKENDLPILSLIQFSKPPFVTFGTVKLGTSKSAILQIENPTEDAEAEVTVEKIPSTKGFSVDHRSFTIQPRSSFRLVITWTPTEEGGVRELLIFNANGVLKHQAILLGRVEAHKKKKKTLWDSIKNKRHGNKANTQTTKKTPPQLKMAANKTFQVSRKPHYIREKPRSPLALINEAQVVKVSSLSQCSPIDDKHLKLDQEEVLVDQENLYHLQKNSPVVLLVPSAKFVDSINLSGCSDLLRHNPENKELTKLFNKTLSPIGTPEKFKRMMPHIQSETLPSTTFLSTGEDAEISKTSLPSLKDALALIDSDLSHINSSPKETSSSCEFSDSLESRSLKNDCEVDTKSVPNSSELQETFHPRLTFFVDKRIASEEVLLPERTKKASFTSATVTKCKAPVMGNSPAGRKVKKSRRRLLENTSKVSDSSSQCDSGPGTPSLPVIDADNRTTLTDDRPHRDKFASSSPNPRIDVSTALHSSPACTESSHISCPVPAPETFTITSPTPMSSSSPVSERFQNVPSQEDMFPVMKSKKRKSEEHSKKEAPDHTKRTKAMAKKAEDPRSLQRLSRSQRGRAAGASSVRASGSRPVKISKVIAVAQSKLTFIKPTRMALPRHPMPFAAKNMFYDERWIEKQERGFTWWLNYILTPDDFKVNTEVTQVNAVSLALGSGEKCSVLRAPTKEEMSFSTYTAKRKLNRLRRAACQLFTSDVMVKAIQRLELEVEARRLLIRKDRHLWKDIGERKKVLNWLLSYNPLWLRIGLETIFGELISLESNSDVLGLAMFILQRLLWNPDIAAEFRHPRVPHLYRDGHEEALSRFTLKKLLLLVCFLDRAKESRMIEHNPCLFCVNAEFKATKDLLLAFSRDFLSGEGILPRHLAYLGLPVSHVQTPLDEFEFAVKNLAVDLKCGVRLVRVMELLVQDWSFSAKLRLPAISRLQKVHNVDVALQVLKSKGLDLKDEYGSVIDSRDIVDGHREKTLSLLWKIIFAFHVEVILDEGQLREEIFFLKRTLRTKRSLASVMADRGVQPCPTNTTNPYTHSSTKVTLLMDWVCAVCDFYNLKVENFTVSFSDGRALCYLIHHYHPSLLPEASISRATTQTVESSPQGRLELSSSGSEADNSFEYLSTNHKGHENPSVGFKELLENEKNNFRQVNSAVSFLGGVPAMINPADMSNTIPNEKVVMSYLSFLCARLLDLRNETRAARVIQAVWRKYRLKKHLQLYEERNRAAMKIQVAVRIFLQKLHTERQSFAAIRIQTAWRGYSARKCLRLKKQERLQAAQHKAATVIQAQWRMFSTMRAYQRLTYYTIVIQAQWRMRRAVKVYERIHWAATVIQKHFRAQALARRDQRHFLLLRAATVKLQEAYRKWKTHKTQQENGAARVIQTVFKRWFEDKMAQKSAAAVKIQSWYRMQLCSHRYMTIRKSAVLIQACYRGYAQRRCFEALKLQHRSAVVIQSAFRGYILRKQFDSVRRAAFKIQRWFRASLKRDIERKKFISLRHAAVTMQAVYRGKKARESLKHLHDAATVIQAAFRKYADRKHYFALRKAATVMQQKYRATILARKVKKEYDALRRAVLTIQTIWRGRTCRKKIATWHCCATVIQASYRRYKVQKEYTSKKAAAIIIQSHYRAFLVGTKMRKEYFTKKMACITLQAGFRGKRVRTELRKKHQAATVIQSVFRMFLCKKKYNLFQSAAIIIQCRYRAALLGQAQQREFRRMKEATIKIQAAFRGFAVRKGLDKLHIAATAIQAQFRMHRIRMAYLATRCATIIIQEHYRSKVLRDQQRQMYRSMKSAAVVIQAAYRGHKTRREMTNMHKAAGVIQRKFLTLRARKQFLAVRRATLYCQQRCRAKMLARKHRSDYLEKRRAAVCLQAAYRGHIVRRQLQIRHSAAVTVQSYFRMFQQRKAYKRLIWACNVLQVHYRANQQMKAEVKAFITKKNATILLQAAVRGMKTRRMLKRSHQAAGVLQRAFRAYCQHRAHLVLKACVLKIQRRHRANVAARTQRNAFQRIRKAAVVLQAAYRGVQVRKEVACWHQAAMVIQSTFRKHRQQVRFEAMRLAVIIIQRCYRAHLLQRRDRAHFLQLKHSVIVVQATFRGHYVRRSIARMHRAATILQANFRRHKEQTLFKQQRWAACVLQQRFKAQMQKRLAMYRYQEIRNAAIDLQAAYRGMKSRQQVKQQREAAQIIQRAYRAHCEHKKYLTLKSSVLIIQRRYRATVLAKEQLDSYQSVRHAVITLQAAYRGCKIRKEMALCHQAALVIQSSYRRHREQVKYQAMRLSAIIIQRYYRALLLQRQDREKFLRMKQSAVILQSMFRGHRVRISNAKMHRAATVLQANFRRHKEQKLFGQQRWAACVLQQKFKAQMQKRLAMYRYQEIRNAAIDLQAAYRGMKSRQQVKQQREAAQIIQRAYRAHCEHKKYLTLKSSVLIIQRRYRATVLAKEQLDSYQSVRHAVITLQAAYRGCKIRKEMALCHQAALVIQSSYRRHREQVKYQAMRLSAIMIQRYYRALLLQRRDREKFLRMKQSAVILQSMFRGHRVRISNAKMHRAATVLQANFRRHKEQKLFGQQRWAACVLQQRFRANRLRNLEAKHYQELKAAAISLQASYRGMKARQFIKREHQAARVIQMSFRTHRRQQQYLRLKSSSIIIQQRFRANKRATADRDRFVQIRRAAITLQRCCRVWRQKQQALKEAQAERRLRFTSVVFHHLCAIKIQRALRAHWALESAKRQIHSVVMIQRWIRVWQQRRRYLENRRKVVMVQRAVKSWLKRRHEAASIIQQAIRNFLLIRRQKRVQHGIVKAQALWRGHRSRILNDSKKIVKLRQRLREVSAGVREEDKLCNKTSSALEFLLRYKHFSYILEALKNLETATRLSPECCERLVKSGATNVLFTLIRSCNRSVPCMDVITFSIQILLNLSKYHKTIEAVYVVENSVETLLDLLQRYREKAGDKVAEKGGSIFTKACFLLALLLQDKHRAEEVMKLPRALDRIRSIYKLTARKHKMDAERTIIRQKTNASINGSFFVPLTPRKSRAPPKFAPDWVLRRDKLKDVVDPLRAIQMVAETLCLGL